MYPGLTPLGRNGAESQLKDYLSSVGLCNFLNFNLPTTLDVLNK
jgi:hypothetical protein